MTAVKDTIAELGGHIEIVSELGKGTRFVFTIPKKANAAATDAADSAA